MFSSKYLTTVAKIRAVVVTRGDRDADEDGGFERIAVSPSFQTCCTLFSDLQMPVHFRIFFQPCSSLGIADGGNYL